MKPTIVVEPAQTESPRIVTHWDDEGSALFCKIEYVETPSPDDLSRKLDHEFNIRPPEYVLTGGTFSMTLDSQNRPKDWDIYTNPEQWIECTFPFIDAPRRALRLHADFDVNNHAEGMGEPELFYEPIRGTLYLSWGEAANWHAIGASLALGATNDGRFAKIRLDGLFVAIKAKRKSGVWRTLRKHIGIHSK